MRIAIFTPWAISDNSIGGTERFVKDLAHSLSISNHNVDVYMLSGKNYKKGNVNYISLDAFGKEVIGDEYKLINTFGNFENNDSFDSINRIVHEKVKLDNYDIIQVNSFIFLKIINDRKIIYTLHSNYQELNILWSDVTIKKIIDTIKNNKFIYCVSPSSYYSHKWADKIGRKVSFIPHAININNFYSKLSSSAIINKYGLSKNKIKILLPSRLELIQKRPEKILDVCKKLPVEYKNRIQIIFTGIDNQYRKNVIFLKKISKKNNLDSIFINFDNISQAYKVSQIIFIPSKSESFGYSALESLALNKITILSDLPSFKEISNNNPNAYLVKDSIEAMKLIMKVVDNTIESQHNYNYDKWVSKYDIKSFGERYMKL